MNTEQPQFTVNQIWLDPQGEILSGLGEMKGKTP